MSLSAGIFQKKTGEIPRIFDEKTRKKGKNTVKILSLYIIITQRVKKVKRKMQKNSTKTKISIFIDEKIYSVGRLKKN